MSENGSSVDPETLLMSAILVVPPLEAMLGEHFSYATAMGGFAAFALIVGCVVIGFGPEAHGVSFRKEPVPLSAK